MEEIISKNIQKAHEDLFRNFDSEVHERLKLNIDTYIDKFSRNFWLLSKYILQNRAEFNDNDHSFYLKCDIDDIVAGKYALISKKYENNNGIIYRTNHPLGEYVIKNGLNISEKSGKVVFNITDNLLKITQVENLKESKGYLTLYKYILDSFDKEEYIWKVANIINESKNILASNKIEYIKLENEKYDESIFETTFSLEHDEDIKDSLYKKLKKNIQIYLVTDSQVERDFADEMEANKAVKVYSKLPSGYKIQTPAGDHTPDWAVVFDSKDVKYIYFIAETKGQNNRYGIADLLQAKIDAMSQLVKAMNQDNFGNVGYGVAVIYQDMWNQVHK